jgi:hypothetical protein
LVKPETDRTNRLSKKLSPTIAIIGSAAAHNITPLLYMAAPSPCNLDNYQDYGDHARTQKEDIIPIRTMEEDRQ